VRYFPSTASGGYGVDFRKLTMGERIVAVAGILLVIDLLFFPWHHVSVSFRGFTVATVNRTGLQSPRGYLGILALIIAIALVVQIILAKFTSVKLPDISMPWSQVHMIGGFAVLGLLLLKLVLRTDFLGFGAWLGIILAAAVAYGGFTINREAQGAAPPP
jgi:hypothetical protein